ncbi:MAG: transposase [Peptoniphilaceae bacterium]|nr:transposase [Peptoniphilaceae bacterium]
MAQKNIIGFGKLRYRAKKEFAKELKAIRTAPNEVMARQRAQALIQKYGKISSKAIQRLEDGIEDSLAFYGFPMLDARKICSTNMLERRNREIRRRTRVVGVFPGENSYVRLVTEYSKEWSTSKAYLSKESLAQMDRKAAEKPTLLCRSTDVTNGFSFASGDASLFDALAPFVLPA